MASQTSIQKVLKAYHVQAEVRLDMAAVESSDSFTHLLLGERVHYCISDIYYLESFHALAKGALLATNYRIILFKDTYKTRKPNVVSKAVQVITKTGSGSFTPIDVAFVASKLTNSCEGNRNTVTQLSCMASEVNKNQCVIDDIISIPFTSIRDFAKVPMVHLIKEKLSLPPGIQIISRIFHDIVVCIPEDNFYSIDYLINQLCKLCAPISFEDVFALKHYKSIKNYAEAMNKTSTKASSYSNVFDFRDEISRLQLDKSNWTAVNTVKQNLCTSLPVNVLIPQTFSLDKLYEITKYYRKGRFPVVCWKHVKNNCYLLRSAATIDTRTNPNDRMLAVEEYYDHICNCNDKILDTKLYVFTYRPNALSVKALLLNRGRKGSDAFTRRKFNYVHSKEGHINAPIVRRNFRQLLNILSKEKDDRYLSLLCETRWLRMISIILRKAVEIALLMEICSVSVIVSYEDGWDFTTQVVCLIQLVSDPYYRTIDGFQVLVQKEWLEFGHPFSKRNLPFLYGDKEEEGPIFVQWLDCVHQIMIQFPYSFEFNQQLLYDLAYHAHSCRFGTFLCNDVSDIKKNNIERTESFWHWIKESKKSESYKNPLYIKKSIRRFILPNYNVPLLKLWKNFYCNLDMSYNGDQSNLLKLHERYKILIKEYEELCDELKVTFDRRLYIGADVAYEDRYVAELTRIKSLQESILKSDDFLNLEEDMDINETYPIRTPSFEASLDFAPLLGNDAKDLSGALETDVEADTFNFQYLLQRKADFTVEYAYSYLVVYYINYYYQGLLYYWEHNVNVEKERCSGYLTKIGKIRKNWKRRWFILDLTKRSLAYYPNENTLQNAKGIIQLESVQGVYQQAQYDHQESNIFSVATGDRTYLIKACNRLEMKIWMALLNDCVKYLISCKYR